MAKREIFSDGCSTVNTDTVLLGYDVHPYCQSQIILLIWFVFGI